MTIINLDNLESYNDFVANRGSVVVKFSATWCKPCKIIAKRFTELSNDEYYSPWKFTEVDIDEGEEIAEQLTISAVPTIIFYKEGQEVFRFTGPDTDKLETKLNAYMD